MLLPQVLRKLRRLAAMSSLLARLRQPLNDLVELGEKRARTRRLQQFKTTFFRVRTLLAQ